jgi:hypothetical protein
MDEAAATKVRMALLRELLGINRGADSQMMLEMIDTFRLQKKLTVLNWHH